MDKDNQDIITSLTSAGVVAILLPEDPLYPAVAAGLGLYLALRDQGKDVEVVCPSEMTVEMNRLVGVDKVKTKLAGRNLVISFDYVKDAIEKVSYNVDGGKFNLVVQPKSGHEPLSQDKVSYSLASPMTDLLVLVGSLSAEDVREVWPDQEGMKAQRLSLVAGDGKTLVAETARLIQSAELSLGQDAAGNLLKGLAAETEQFARATVADFAMAAELAKVAPTDVGATVAEKVEGEKKEVEVEQALSQSKHDAGSNWSGPPRIYRSGEIG